jgi:predicted DNA-binding transcriptional regulator AlpA
MFDHNLDPILSERELAAWLGISLPSLQRMRSSGRGPHFIQLSNRRIGYRKSTVEQWLEARTIARVGDSSAGYVGRAQS